MRVALTSLIFLGLAACASNASRSGEGPSGPTVAELQFQCAERGGVLAPSGGPLTGRPSLDYNCRVSPAEPSPRVDGR
jgi:hypothetical protein